MSDKILELYKTLEELLRAEHSAFQEKAFQRLAALAPQIQQSGKKIGDLEDSLNSLSSEQASAVKELIFRLQKHVDRSRCDWERYQRQLEEQRNLLQSSRRFLHEARLGQSARGSRISHSA